MNNGVSIDTLSPKNKVKQKTFCFLFAQFNYISLPLTHQTTENENKFTTSSSLFYLVNQAS